MAGVVEARDPEGVAAARLRTAFECVSNPMVLVDDQRWCVTANAPACGLLALVPEEVPWYRLDDFSSTPDRERVDEFWQAFLANGAMEGWYQLPLPSGGFLPIEFSATANVLPGRHLSVIVPRPDKAASAIAKPSPDRHAKASTSVIAAARTEWIRVAPRNTDQVALTQREREVLGLIAGGLQGGRIAERLVLSADTIKTHAQNAMAKLGAHTRAHAVAIALSTGQIDFQGDAQRQADGSP